MVRNLSGWAENTTDRRAMDRCARYIYACKQIVIKKQESIKLALFNFKRQHQIARVIWASYLHHPKYELGHALGVGAHDSHQRFFLGQAQGL